MLIDLSQPTTLQGFGDVVGIGKSAVHDLVGRGILRDGGSMGEWLIDYCAHIREIAAGRAGSGDLDLVTERAGLAKAQRERIEMQNAVTRRELAPVVLIEEVLAKAGSRVAGILDAIPGMVKRRVPGLTSDVIDMIRGEIARARNLAASVSLADLRDEPAPVDEDVSSDVAGD